MPTAKYIQKCTLQNVNCTQWNSNAHCKTQNAKSTQQNAHYKIQTTKCTRKTAKCISKMQNFKSTRQAILCIGWASMRSRERRARSVTKLLYHLQHSKLFTMPLICRRQAVCTPWALQNHCCCWINTPPDETKDWQRGVLGVFLGISSNVCPWRVFASVSLFLNPYDLPYVQEDSG